MANKNGGIKIAAQNKKAYHDYFVEEKYEAGIELFGTEVKSIRAGSVNLKDSYCDIKDGELLIDAVLCADASSFLNPEYLVSYLKSATGILTSGDLLSETYTILRREAFREDMTPFL